MTRSRLLTLMFLVAVVVLMVLVAASLSRLELKPAEGFQIGEASGGALGFEVPESSELLSWIIRIVGILAILAVPLYIYLNIRSPEGRRRLLIDFLYISILATVLFLLFRNPLPVEEMVVEETQEAIPFDPEGLPQVPLEEFDPAETPPWIDWAALAVVAVVVTGILVGFIWYFRRREPPEPSPYDVLARQAQAAVDEIQAGFDLRSAIIRCYADMAKTLQKERNIYRNLDMTPREFERLLEGKGVPGESVRRLTRLFEEVRYGNRQPGPKDEQLALLCLNSIIDFCRNPQGQVRV